MAENSKNEAQRPRDTSLQERILLAMVALLLGIVSGLIGGIFAYMGGATIPAAFAAPS